MTDPRQRIEELQAFYGRLGKPFCGADATGHVLELAEYATAALDREAELEQELAQAQKMRDFYIREGASDFEWGKAERARYEQRDLWAKAWKAAAGTQAYWVAMFKGQGRRLLERSQKAEVENKRLRAVEAAVEKHVGTHGCTELQSHGSDCLTLGWKPSWRCPPCTLRAALLEAPTDD